MCCPGRRSNAGRGPVFLGASPDEREATARVDEIANIDNNSSMLVFTTMSRVSELDPDDTRPPYVQVADALRSEIVAGTLAPGAKLASHRTLADRYGVSVGTVKRALGELQGAGLVVSRQGQGAFVRTQLPAGADGGTGRPTELDVMKRALASLGERVAAIERRLDDQ